MVDKANIFVIRALNYWRVQYLPTYVGLRLLARATAVSHQTALIENLSRHLAERRYGKYKPYLLFKGFAEDGNAQFRECLASSPQLAILEAQVLHDFSRSDAFRLPTHVYSYLWPTDAAGGSYRYFVDDYDRRNEDVRRAVSSRGDSAVVLVIDVSNFYPSIDRARLLKKLDPMLQSLGSGAARAHRAVDLLIGGPGKGLPVGPALSHALANVYLSELDVKLGKKFQSNYTRYVDDIVIVCPSRETDEVELYVRGALEEEGLQVNATKLDRVAGVQWTAKAPRLREYQGDISTVEGLGDMIRGVLLRRPDDFDTLQRVLFSEGIPIPLERYRAHATNRRWRTMIASRLRRQDPRLQVLAQWIDQDQPTDLYEVVRAARKLRSLLLGKLEAAASSSPEGVTVRRWHQHVIKRLAGRLLYLIPRDQLAQLLDRVPDILELKALRLVVESLQSESAEAVVSLPGGPANSLGFLWRRHRLPRVPITADLSHFREYEACLALVLSGVVTLSPSQRDTARPGHARILLETVCGVPAKARSLSDHSYSDEVQALALGVSAETFTETMTSGFEDEDESDDLDLLMNLSG